MNMQPYFYIIQHTLSSMYYAGYKSYGSNSDDLMTASGYKTSSKVVKRLIAKDGLDAFIIKRIRHFDTAQEAYMYEFRFLNKVDAKNNQMFLNLSNGRSHAGFCMTDKFKKYMSEIKTGTKWSVESRNKVSITRTGKPLSSWHRAAISDGKKGIKFSDEHRENISKGSRRRAPRGKHKVETIEKMRETHRKQKALGIKRTRRSDESYIKQSDSMKGQLWWTNGIITVKSIDSPGEGWIRGRRVNAT